MPKLVHPKKPPAAIPDRRMWRVPEFCAAFRLSQSTVYKMLKDGTLDSVVIAGRRLIPVEAGEKLLAPTEGKVSH